MFPFSIMLQRLLHTFTLLALIVWGLSACSKLEEETDEPIPNGNAGNTDNEGNDVEMGDTISVTQALGAPLGSRVIVKGYVVGYINGTTMSKAVFGAPQDKVNSNIIIANSPTESDHTRCMPVQTKKGSDEQLLFNLLEAPHLLGTCVIVDGVLTTYFRVNGFKHPDFWITQCWDEGNISPPEEEPTPEPEPEPEPEPAPASETPTLDHTPQANIYGR